MSLLIVNVTSLARTITPKLQALGARLARALDNFAEARMRNAVPQWRLREAQREIDRCHRLMHAGRPATAGRSRRLSQYGEGGTLRGARGSAESRSSVAARPSYPRRMPQPASAAIDR